jgi:capsular exopolysaccharide synthesis family protein
VKITPIDNEHCYISADDFKTYKRKIEFETKYRYGDSLRNEYFNFVLNKEPGVSIDEDKEYILVFNDLNKLAVEYQKRLDISLLDIESQIIVLKIEGQQREREADFLNELCQVYIDYGLRAKNRTAENTVNFIDSQLTGIVDSLQSTGRSFTNFRSRNRIVDLNQEAGLVVERLEQLDTEESTAQMQLEYYQNLRSYLGEADKMEQVVAPSVVGVTDPVLNSMVVKLSELYSQRSTLRFSVQEKNPSLLALENEISYTQETLEENLNNLIDNAQLQLNKLRERKSQMSSQLARLPKTEQDMINIKRQFDVNNDVYTFLLQKKAEAAITKASNVPDANILDPASIETSLPISPLITLNLIIGLFLGLGIPVFVIAVGFYFDNTIKSKEDIEKETTIPVIGTIGRKNKKTELTVLNEPHSGVAESFRGLRTNLDYFSAQNGHKVVAVHSTVPGEGKTFTAINLAISIAQNNKSVLLIGADLRKPKIDTILNINSGNSGLSNYLINRSKIEDIVINAKIKNLAIIPPGPIPPNPAELLGNGNFEKLVNKVKEHFDFIIIDDAPATVVTDAILVAKFADVNLFVTRSEFTQKDHVRMIDQLKSLGTMKNLAIVLNDIPKGRKGYHNYYGKGYGIYAEKKFKNNKEVQIEEVYNG